MDSDLLKIASTQGVWAALAVALIFYILKTQEKRDLIQSEREQKYQEIIEKLTDKFNIIEDVKADIQEIKDFIFKKNDNYF